MRRLVPLVIFAGITLLSSPAIAAAQGPLITTVYIQPTERDNLYFERARSAGATAVRLLLNWSLVAPTTRPDGFRATDPSEAAYRWQNIDRQVSLAAQFGLEPLVTVMFAPRWAEGQGSGREGTVRPDATEFADFALAVARRYSGTYENLPRVRYWQGWNEPNIHLYLNPQIVAGRPFSPGWYRGMLNRFAVSIHSVHKDNVVVAAGLAPFRDNGVTAFNWGPLGFMRNLLCISKKLNPTCKTRVQFDVWATHPYTSGGPTHHAALPDDVSLGDLPEMRSVLRAAARAGHIASHGEPRFWVTEFAWDSKPPDPKGVPVQLEARWIAEALYRMWLGGVGMVTWLTLYDSPLSTSFYQSGLYYYSARPAAARPKPALRAFRFPQVAFPQRRGSVIVWGRTPRSTQDRIRVEQTFHGGWKQLGVLSANRSGIFSKRFRTGALGSIRSIDVRTGERSLPFSLRAVPDRFFNPFGLESLLEPKKKGGKR